MAHPADTSFYQNLPFSSDSRLHSRFIVTDGWERMYPEQKNVPLLILGSYLTRRAYELSAIFSELAALCSHQSGVGHHSII